MHAQAVRPKVIELTGTGGLDGLGSAFEVKCSDAPQTVLSRTAASIKRASFVSGLERERLTTLLANMEFFQNRAMDEAQQLMQLDRFSVSRDLLRQLKKITAVTLPANRPWSAYERVGAAVDPTAGGGGAQGGGEHRLALMRMIRI